jgi:hypothetical protein
MNKNRNKETFREFFEENENLPDDDFQILLEKKFGKPPYEFLEEGDVHKRSLKRKRNNTLKPEYKAKFPQPNYYNFKQAEYVDNRGREYILGSGTKKDQLIESGLITHKNYSQPPLHEGGSFGVQMFWLRIPIKRDKKISSEYEIDSRITLYHIKTQVECTGTIESVYIGKSRKTGYAIIRNFKTHGKLANPKVLMDLL